MGAAYSGAGWIASMFIDELTTNDIDFFTTGMCMPVKFFALRPVNEGDGF
jgi:hypothetical protein